MKGAGKLCAILALGMLFVSQSFLLTSSNNTSLASISPITPNEYLERYVWALNRLLDHRHETLKMIDSCWDAQTNYPLPGGGWGLSDTLCFFLTLPTLLEAYKITGNETYLSYAKECFDKGVQYCYNPDTKLFAQEWRKTTGNYVNELNLLWASVLLNSMFDLYGVTKNSTHELYANNYAEGLHTYGVTPLNLVHEVIRVSDGSVVSHDSWVSRQYGRMIGAYIKGYQFTGIEKYETWAKEIAEAFWSYREPQTNLYPEYIDSRDYTYEVTKDTNMPPFDPIQNVLLYAYEVTKDSYWKSLTINVTNAQISYGWKSNLGRMVNSIYLNGTVKSYALNLVYGPQMYIVGLLQLYHFTSNSSYLSYAETFWNTLHDKALVNGLYITNLDENNNPDDLASLYTHEMMAQADPYLYHFTKNQKYLVDLKDTVNNFLLHFTCPYGTCLSVKASTYEIVDGSTDDWLDSTSYVLGSAIYLYSVYSTQTTTTVDADLTYYMPYFPILKPVGKLNYANNQLDFKVTGTDANLNLTFTFPRGKTVDTITMSGSSIFLYIKNASQLLICDAGTYSISVTMTNGAPQDITVKAFNFTNDCLTVTLTTLENLNVTLKLHIPFNETSQTPFPNDIWDVNCTETNWGTNWNPMNRILTVWAISDGSTTIKVSGRTTPVGGICIPVDKLSLLTPWIALTTTIILAITITAIILKYKKKSS